MSNVSIFYMNIRNQFNKICSQKEISFLYLNIQKFSSQIMNCIQESQISMVQSQISSQQLSSSSYLLQSKVSEYEMNQMSYQNLLSKLLQLYENLEKTQQDNQFLRIQKADLRNQLESCKSKAEQFLIQSKQRCSIKKNMEAEIQRNTFNKNQQYQSPQQSVGNCFITPFQSEEQFQQRYRQNDILQKVNKVFVKTHRRGISNNCINSKSNIMLENNNYNSSLNSPLKNRNKLQKNSKSAYKDYKDANSHQRTVIQKQCPQLRNGYKLQFPKQKLDSLVIMERQYEQNYQNQNLQNFQSFYCHRNDLFNTTKRDAYHPSSLPKTMRTKQNFSNKQTYKRKWIQPSSSKSRHNTQNSQETIKKSMSSSNLSDQYNVDHQNKKGFKIPSSIQQIWQSSKPSIDLSNILSGRNRQNKISKLSKTSIKHNGIGNFQKKSYLNQHNFTQFYNA